MIRKNLKAPPYFKHPRDFSSRFSELSPDAEHMFFHIITQSFATLSDEQFNLLAIRGCKVPPRRQKKVFNELLSEGLVSPFCTTCDEVVHELIPSCYQCGAKLCTYFVNDFSHYRDTQERILQRRAVKRGEELQQEEATQNATIEAASQLPIEIEINKKEKEESITPSALKIEEREHGTVKLVRHLVQPVGVLSEHVGSELMGLGLSDSAISDVLGRAGHRHSWTYYLNALRLAKRKLRALDGGLKPKAVEQVQEHESHAETDVSHEQRIEEARRSLTAARETYEAAPESTKVFLLSFVRAQEGTLRRLEEERDERAANC